MTLWTDEELAQGRDQDAVRYRVPEVVIDGPYAPSSAEVEVTLIAKVGIKDGHERNLVVTDFDVRRL